MLRFDGWRWPVTAVFLALLAGAPTATARPIVAVFDIENRQSPLAARAVDGLTDYLVALIAASGAYEVVPREQVRERLVAQKKESYRACYAESCQIEMGRELAANKSLSTVVLRFGKDCQVTATLYDLARATTERAATAGGPCTEDGVKAAIESVARDLCAGARQDQEKSTERPGEPLAGVRDEIARSLGRTGLALLGEGKPDEAIPLLRKAVQREPAPALLRVLAGAYEEAGQWGAARDEYQRYLEVEKDPAAANAARQRLEGVLDRIPGRLVLALDPADASVEVDGTPTGPWPAAGQDLKRGPHRVRARAAGFEDQELSVEVAPGRTVSLPIRLRPAKGQVLVDCDCAGASVRIDGSVAGQVPLGGPVTVTPGRHQVAVEAAGRVPFATAVDVAPGGIARVPVSLAALPVESPARDPAITHDGTAEDRGIAGVARRADAPGPRRAVRIPLSLALSEGILRYDGATHRTHVGMEVELGLRFAAAEWLVPSLGLGWTIESPVNVTLRPGIRWYFGSFPMYVRTAALAMVTPARSWGFLAGLGGDVPLWKHGFLRLEADVGVWSTSVVPVDFVVGIGHAL